MTDWCIHGWNTHGKSIDGLRDALIALGRDANDFDYGKKVARWRTVLANAQAAISLCSIVEPGDTLVCHSNANLIAHMALLRGCKARKVVMISPALDSDIKTYENHGWLWRKRRSYPSLLERVIVMWTPHDKATRWAKWVPFSKWGSMGNRGYTGANPLFKSIRHGHINGHSEWFTAKHLEWTAARVDEHLGAKT